MSKNAKQVSRKLAYWASVTAIGLVVGISLQMVRANWTVPTGAAPMGNIGAPVNTGGTLVTPPQRKTGSLAVDGAFFDVKNNLYVESGNVGIGTTTPTQKLDVAGQIHSSSDVCTDAGGGKCLNVATQCWIVNGMLCLRRCRRWGRLLWRRR